MLSRVAEALYWIGRYVERAEDTSRLLDVELHALLEDPWGDEQLACLDLLRTMGIDDMPEPVEISWTTQRLAFSAQDTSSIAGAWTAARDNARGVREILSSEVWECLNGTYHELAGHQRSTARLGPGRFLRLVRERAATVAGLVEGTMPKDDAWRFLILGRSIERVDMTARLLWIGLQSRSPSWVAVLKCCSAYEAYLRTYRVAPEPSRVLEFLLLDRLFPRSVFASLVQAELCLEALEPTAGRVGVQDEARRYLGGMRTDLEFHRPTDLIIDLGTTLTALQSTCVEVGKCLAAKHFRTDRGSSWAVGTG